MFHVEQCGTFMSRKNTEKSSCSEKKGSLLLIPYDRLRRAEKACDESRRDRQPKGWCRKDDNRHQPGVRPGAFRTEVSSPGSGPPVEFHSRPRLRCRSGESIDLRCPPRK